MSRKRKRTSVIAPDQQAEMLVHRQELERRIEVVEAELAAKGSVYAEVPRERLVAFAIERAEAELAAKRRPA